MTKSLLLLAAGALVGVAFLMPSASASECLLYEGDWKDPGASVNIPLVTGSYGPCSSECSGVVHVDKWGAAGCVLPEDARQIDAVLLS